MDPTLKNCLLIICTIAAFIILTSLWGFYWAIRPPHRLISSITPAHFGLKYDDVSFETKDHVLIRGWFIPNTNPKAKTIILLHGYPADKGNILPALYYLHKDYHLLFFDFRYFGESGGSYSTVGQNEVLDLLAAIQFLEKKGIHEVGVYGFSLGGAVALMTAEKAPQIKAIVAESSYARLDMMLKVYYHIPLFKYPLSALTRLWGIVFLGYDVKDVSPMKAASTLTIPVLIIHSKTDEVTPFDQAEFLKNALHKNKNAEFLFQDNTKHGELTQQTQITIKRFFDKYL